jgi:2OG-Fe(II) oxygenase superfamily
MAKTARERLAWLLDDSEPGGSFSAELLVPAHLLRLEVAGVGLVSLPVRAPQAKKLIAVARPAMFGRWEETLTDTKVRDTWEITPDQIRLGGPGWTALMDGALEHFRDELGLPPVTRLRAEPHSMLVYGKGQFFLPHQDSEKDDAMVGTLVVSPPSAYTGGELVVEHAGESKAYRASREDLTFVAFYADCRHEVTPVRSGYRVTLTFNLLSGNETPRHAAGPVTELARCLAEHFATPATTRYGGRDLDPPTRLVYLLDHEYTQRGLNWNGHKGVDAERAALLSAAAEQAGCQAVLALAEVKETWDAWPSDEDPWDDYDYDEEDEDEDYDDAYRDGARDHDDYQLNDLIDDEITPGWWTSPDGTVGERSCCTSLTRRCVPPPRAPTSRRTSPSTRVTWATTATRWTGGTAGPRSWCGRGTRRSRRAQKPGRGGAVGTARPHRGRRPGRGPCRRGVARAVLENDRIAGGTAGYGAARGGRPGRCRDGGDAAGAVPGGDGRAGTRGRAGGCGRAIRRAVDAPGHRRVVRPGALLRNRQVRVDREAAAAVRGAASRRRSGSGAAAGRRAWRWMGAQLRFWTTAGRAEVRQVHLEMLSSPLVQLLEAADGRLRDEIVAVLRGCGDRVLGCLMPGGGTRSGRAGLRGPAGRDHRAAAARCRRLVDPMGRVRVRPV